MKILVTGATGFVGVPLCRRLHELGHELIILSRDSEKARQKIPFKTVFFNWNPHEEMAPAEAFAGVDSVIHLAGEGVAEKRWSKKQKEKIYTSRVLGTRHLVKTINSLKNKPKSFVSASAIGIYGDRSGEELSEESISAQNDFLTQVCIDWEKAAQEVDSKVAFSIIRTGIVLGKNGGALKKMLLPFSLGLGGKIASGQHWMSWIHIKDLVEMYVHCATKNATGIWNGVAPQAVRNFEFTKILGQVLHRPTLFPLPALVLKILFGEMATILIGSQHCVPRQAVKNGFVFRFPKLQDALMDILTNR